MADDAGSTALDDLGSSEVDRASETGTLRELDELLRSVGIEVPAHGSRGRTVEEVSAWAEADDRDVSWDEPPLEPDALAAIGLSPAVSDLADGVGSPLEAHEAPAEPPQPTGSGARHSDRDSAEHDDLVDEAVLDEARDANDRARARRRRLLVTGGNTIVTVGVLLLAFVAYTLWGTGIQQARAQQSLEREFAALQAPAAPSEPGVDQTLDLAPITTDPSSDAADAPTTDGAGGEVVELADEATEGVEGTGPETSGAASSGERAGADPTDADGTSDAANGPVRQELPVFEAGGALAQLQIPKIGVDEIVVAGVSVEDLRRGPGHFPGTPLPGQLGNAAIAGHRTTYGAPFLDVDELDIGDEIVAVTPGGRFVYRVTGSSIVAPTQVEVIATVDPTIATLTLTSCNPVYSARERIVISAALDEEASAPVGIVTDYQGDDLLGPTVFAGVSETVPIEDDSTSDASATGEVDAGATGAAATEAGEATENRDDATGDRAETVPALGSTNDTTPRSAEEAEETDDASGEAVGAATVDEGSGPAAATGGSTSTPAIVPSYDDGFDDGWFDDRAAIAPLALAGVMLVLIALAATWLSRRTGRNLIGAAAGILPFVVVLYVFFQALHRMMPAAI